MTEERNQVTEGVAIHDVVVLHKHQRTGEDGKKKGYSWGSNDQIGVVIQHSADGIKIKKPDMEEEEYLTKIEDGDDYFYTISRGSEIQYTKEIDEAGTKAQKQREDAQEIIMELKRWRHDFEHSISFIGRFSRFIKAFVKSDL